MVSLLPTSCQVFNVEIFFILLLLLNKRHTVFLFVLLLYPGLQEKEGHPISMDRCPTIPNKSTSGGMCFYINEQYCNTIVVREQLAPLILDCCPFPSTLTTYPRNFLSCFTRLACVYISTQVPMQKPPLA